MLADIVIGTYEFVASLIFTGTMVSIKPVLRRLRRITYKGLVAELGAPKLTVGQDNAPLLGLGPPEKPGTQ
jgi:hypothetical protein